MKKIQIPNNKLQINSKFEFSNFKLIPPFLKGEGRGEGCFGYWNLGFVIYLLFGACYLGFKGVVNG